MFELIGIVALLGAGLFILVLARRLQSTEQRAAEAEEAAGRAWSTAYQAATTEINAKRDREYQVTRDKAWEAGWNACVDEYETRPSETARTA